VVEDALGGTSRSLDGGGGKRVVLVEGMLQAETSTKAAPAHIFVK
jgi:hypothetical protein